MNWVFIFLIISLFSCSQEDRDKRWDYIQGEWIFDTSNLNMIDSTVLSRVRESDGFLFRGDTCEFQHRLFPLGKDFICHRMTKGYSTHFRLEGDTLKVWYTDEENWRSFLISSLNQDSMVLVAPERAYDLRYVRPTKNKLNVELFDEIVIRKLLSGDGHECSSEFFHLNKEGVFLHHDERGKKVHTYLVEPKLLDTLFSNFNYLDVKSLHSEYVDPRMSGRSVHYEVTFMKNRRVLKRVMDSTLVSPDELLRGYIPIVLLPNRLVDGGIRKPEGDVNADLERMKRLWKE